MKRELRRRSAEVRARAVRAGGSTPTQPWMCLPLLLGALAAAVAMSRGVEAQDDRDVEQPRNCVDLMRVDRTQIVDDDTVLFYMRSGAVYRNELRHSCPTLGFEERFMYRTTLTQLCDIDVITVLQDVGFGFMPTASCGLGKFQPIGEQAAEELVAQAGREQRRR